MSQHSLSFQDEGVHGIDPVTGEEFSASAPTGQPDIEVGHGQDDQQGPQAPLPGLLDFTQPLEGSPLGLADVNETVDTAFEHEGRTGRRNLLESATAAAGRRGLERTDTPVFDPFLRASADFESRLGSAKAGAKLGFGERARNFREQSFQGRQGLFQNNQQFFNNQAFENEQFQERIKTQAFQNRLQLAKLGSDIGLGLARIRAGSANQTIELDPSFSSLLDSLGKGFELLGGGIDAFF